MKPDLPVPSYPVNIFDWDREHNRLTVEASQLSRAGIEWWARLYSDACDIGIKITGRQKEEYFSIIDEVESDDGEVLYWVLKPVDRACRLHDVIVWND